jgi:hypothetical protein
LKAFDQTLRGGLWTAYDVECPLGGRERESRGGRSGRSPLFSKKVEWIAALFCGGLFFGAQKRKKIVFFVVMDWLLGGGGKRDMKELDLVEGFLRGGNAWIMRELSKKGFDGRTRAVEQQRKRTE